jgi:cell division transport system ATP-binding protein
MIKFENVTKIYQSSNPQKKEVVALKDISFEVKEKEFVCLVGKSGAGKTTLLKLILGEEKPTKGKIFFEGEEINKISSSKLYKIRRKIGTVFQDYKLLPKKTAAENLSYVMEALGFPDSQIKKDVPQVLEIVGLLEKSNYFIHELSAGEKQKLTIARALIHRPKVILADEPTGNLDPYNRDEIIKILLKINEMVGATVILATHDKEIVQSVGKRVISLIDGKIVRDEEKGQFFL